MALAFDPMSLTQEQAKAVLSRIAKDSYISEEKMEALYVVLGDDLFFMLFLLSGDEIRVPGYRALRSIYKEVAGQDPAPDKESQNGKE